MAPLPAVPGVLRVKKFWQIGTDVNALNRFYVAYTGTAPSPTTCATIAQDIEGFFTSSWLSLVATQSASLGVSIEDLTSPTSGAGEYLHTTAGTRSGGALGAGMCVLVNGHILRRYRGGKPRLYLPLGAGGDMTDQNDWDATVTNSANTLMSGLQTDLAGVLVSGTQLTNMVNVSYYEPPLRVITYPSGRTRNASTLRTTPVVDVINTWTSKTHVASQRRRNLMRS